MSLKPYSALIIGALAIAVLYEMIRYAAPDQINSLTEQVNSPSQGDLVLEDILPVNDANKVHNGDTAKYEIGGFFLGQDEASAPCQPEYLIKLNVDGTPRAKSKQCTIRDYSSKTNVYFYNNRVVGIESLVYIKKNNIDNILKLLNSKYVNSAPDKNNPPEKLDVTKSIFGKFHNFDGGDDSYSIVVNIKNCLTNDASCKSSSEYFDFPRSPEYNFLITYDAPFLGDRTVAQLSEIPLTRQEYNVEAKRLGIAPLPREYSIERVPFWNYGPIYEDVLEVCLQWVDSLNKSKVNKYGVESKTVVKSAMSKMLWKKGWDHSDAQFMQGGRFAEYGSNYVLEMYVQTESRSEGSWPVNGFDNWICIVSPSLEFIGAEYFEW